ncbi:MAG: glycosyltransferase family 4 protein [Caulobacter sp.]|nr:glycosyltransferase family 4 protein [Caulobacter sp.]
MKITLVEPGASTHPVGGSLVVFEYANRLSALGHDVTILFPASTRLRDPLRRRLKLWSRFRRWGRTGQWKPSWFALSPKVKLVWARRINERWAPDGDVIVATVSEVIPAIEQLPTRCGRKVYFAQIWRPELEPQTAKAWPLIVIARAMEAAARGQGFSPVYIPNGLEHERFRIETPLAKRDPASICLLFNRAPHKAFGDAVAALERVRAQGHALDVTAFGITERLPEVPAWMAYEQLPSRDRLREIYNGAAIFVSSSLNEGWGLPACEAGLSGCALAITDNQGHREFAEPERTALLSPPGDPDALAANIVRLIQDPALRERLNAELRAGLAAFTWDHAVSEMARTLEAAAGA